MSPLVTILLVGLAIFFGLGYVKAPPDTAIIISGIRRKPRVLIGKAGVKLPFFERKDVLTLAPITIDVNTDEHIPTLDFINVKVDAVAKVQVNTVDPGAIQLAMRNFLNKKQPEIMRELQDSLQGNMREIIGTLTLKDICNNRDEFGKQVQSKADEDMRKLGMTIISCNIQNIRDRSGLIEDMGMDNTSKIKKEAAIAKAQAERDIAIAQAEADKDANDARVLAQTEIAKRNNELAIKQAELQIISDQKQAEADVAYKIESELRRKDVEVNKVNADIAERERIIELKKKEAEVAEQSLNAEVKKQAEAKRYAMEQAAEVELFQQKKAAEAKRYQEEQEAEALKKKAEAEKFAAE